MVGGAGVSSGAVLLKLPDDPGVLHGTGVQACMALQHDLSGAAAAARDAAVQMFQAPMIGGAISTNLMLEHVVHASADHYMHALRRQFREPLLQRLQGDVVLE